MAIEHTPSQFPAIVERATTEAQRVLVSTLHELAKSAAASGFTAPALVVIGEVVRLQSKLDWFGERDRRGEEQVREPARWLC